MSEDQIIVIASKPFDGEARTRIAHVASLRDNLKILTNKGVSEQRKVSFQIIDFSLHTESRIGTIEGTLQQGTTRRLVHRFETWKTQDDLNFVKSSDVTQVIVSTAQNQETAANSMRRQKFLREVRGSQIISVLVT